MNAIQKNLKVVNETAASGALGHWAYRHQDAWEVPRGPELPLKTLIIGLSQYGEAQRKLGSKVGDDGVLGKAFAGLAKALLVLLNGDLGRFDGGTLDRLVRAICEENGVELEP